MPLEHALQRRGLFPSPGPWKQPKAVPAVLTQPLGMDMLPRQKHIKTKRKPYQLNVMVVGESGLGKSTFVNTLFYADLKDTLPKVPQDTKTVDITPVHFELEEDGVKLHLCLIDTPGFGDRLNRDQDVHPILEYIDQQYEAFYEAEKHVGFRRIIKDTRVHACLYFISPTGHSMKELDIKTLQELSSKVTVIPVIAKADTMTADEKKEFKKALLEDLALHEIPIYPNAYPDEHREPMDDTLQHVPFAVMGSNEDVQLPDGKTVRGRAYRWGTVEVENHQHCDMAHLRQLLMIECLHELGDIAHHHHYHDYRLRLLQAQGREDILMKCDEDYDAHIEGMTKNLAKEMSEREENMRKQFVDMVQNTEDDLKQREQELQRKREAMMKELEEQQRQIAQLEQDLNDKLKLRSAAK